MTSVHLSSQFLSFSVSQFLSPSGSQDFPLPETRPLPGCRSESRPLEISARTGSQTKKFSRKNVKVGIVGGLSTQRYRREQINGGCRESGCQSRRSRTPCWERNAQNSGTAHLGQQANPRVSRAFLFARFLFPLFTVSVLSPTVL